MFINSREIVSFDQTKISYSITGSGFPLVLLHGNGGSARYFKKQIKFFSAHYSVIAIDSRDHGHSGNNSTVLNFPQMAKDVAAVLAQEKITNCHLLGFSDGAVLAMAVAIAYPSLVDKLVLVAANTTTDGLKSYSLWTAKLGVSLMTLFAPFSKKSRKWVRLLTLITKDSGITTDQLNDIHAETLVITGDRDIIRQEHTAYISQSIPNSQQVIVKNATHNLIQTKVGVINNLVSNFLAQKN